MDVRPVEGRGMSEELFDKHEFTLPSGRKVTVIIPVPLSKTDKEHLKNLQTLIELTTEAILESENSV